MCQPAMKDYKYVTFECPFFLSLSNEIFAYAMKFLDLLNFWVLVALWTLSQRRFNVVIFIAFEERSFE